MDDLLYRAYLENISETRRFLERQENRLYALLAEQRISQNTRRPSHVHTSPLQTRRSNRQMISPPAPPIDPLRNIITDLLRDIGSGLANDADWSDPVSIAPTQEQINRAVRRRRFGDIENPISNVCPIRQTEFDPNDDVIIINRCRHIFGQDELTEWFTRSPRCPVCRCDIRDMSNNDSNTTNVVRVPELHSITIDVNTTDSDYSRTFDEPMRSYLSEYDNGTFDGIGVNPDNSITVGLRDGSGNTMRSRNFNVR